MENHILSIITFFPLAGALLLFFMPAENKNLLRWITVFFTGVPVLLAVYIYLLFSPTNVGFTEELAYQFVEKRQWIPSFNIHYHIGVDGLSVTMVILTAIVTFVGAVASFSIDKAVKAYFILYLILTTAITGVFVSLDFFLFYVFWEVMLLPMYFLIGIWGGPRKEYASIKFFLYTFFGSVFMLVVMLMFYFATGSFSFIELSRIMVSGEYPSFFSLQWVRVLSWFLLFVGFAIKIPAFPFHTWLPDAHVEAPTAISVILAGVLLKMGTYGLLRISFPLLPEETLRFAFVFLGILGVINILYGAMVAMAQTDLKKLIAYSSVSHMGYVMLGMASFTVEGFSGALFQMFNHGTITAMLFILVGVVYDRAHHRDIDGFGGLAQVTPRFAAFTGIAFFAGLGLPGLSGFISEALVFLGSFKSHPILTFVAVFGIVLTAAYMLWAYMRIFFGKVNEKYRNLEEINLREIISLLPVAIFVIWFGVYPMPYLEVIEPTMQRLLDLLAIHDLHSLIVLPTNFWG